VSQPLTLQHDLKTQALAHVAFGLKTMSIWTPDGWKAPKGFPRRTLLCKPTQGGNTWSVSAAGMCRFLRVELA
jgi:hypothetical protein